jgi:hypothetical protein
MREPEKPSRSTMPTPAQENASPEPDIHKGTIEGDRLEDEQQANRNVPALDAEGLPNQLVSIAEERIGANVDDDEVANASETGQTSDAPRDEVAPLSDRRAGRS